MNWRDGVNGAFEALAGVMVFLHVLRLLRDKKVAGVSLLATAFFTSWGFWNIYYYPSIGQQISFYGGLAVVVANCAWVSLMAYYVRHPGGRA